ncbi:MAG: SUMF1/EgtB/PvdO family nonheme iron enzyme [Chloroflexota bacterium]
MRSFDQREVEIKEDFKLSIYAVTFDQFETCVQPKDVWDECWWQDVPETEKRWGDQTFKYRNHPRERVSWYQAVALGR